MAALSLSPRLVLPIAPLAAGLAGAAVAAAIAGMPAPMLESLVLDSGIAAVIPAAAPPLGLTARLALVLLGAGGIAAFVWLAASVALGERTVTLAAPARPRPRLVLRRADAHPDAPAREPVLAMRDLGAPLPSVIDAGPAAPSPVERVEIERPLPRDLDTPLAAFAPAGFDGDRFRIETFELTPPVRPAPRAPDAITARETDATVLALLARLEQGIARRQAETRAARAPEQDERSLETALATLRRMAAPRR